MAEEGKYRRRTVVRSHLPWWVLRLGVAPKGKHDCGDHDWYRHDDATMRCYHCEPGELPIPAPSSLDADHG